MKLMSLVLISSSLSVSLHASRMWICTEQTSTVMGVSGTEMRLTCRPYDPAVDGSDLTVRYEFYLDWRERLALDVEVTADSISFEEVSLVVVLSCSDGRKPTESLSFRNIEVGTSETAKMGGVFGELCREDASIESVSIWPEWADDWRCDGCGTHAVKLE